ncbi:MAG TPA: hypothetical protein VFC37_09900 [Terracidiphilus sp.]|nr:hypothetical protein [Terracidiphilus sp.]
MAGQQRKADEGQQRDKSVGEVVAHDGETQQPRQAAPAEVGIIFLLGNTLLIDSTPVDYASDYGALKTHEKGHPDYWEELQHRGAVPAEVEYDQVPRGRVTADPKRGTVLLFLDRCILRRSDLVDRIREVMHLPPGAATEVGTDSHYVCPGCSPMHQPADDDDD